MSTVGDGGGESFVVLRFFFYRGRIIGCGGSYIGIVVRKIFIGRYYEKFLLVGICILVYFS